MNNLSSKQMAANKLSVWFNGLRESEQRLMVVGSLLIAMALLWVLVYQPVVAHIANQVNVKNRLQSQLIEMQNLAGSSVKQTTLPVCLP